MSQQMSEDLPGDLLRIQLALLHILALQHNIPILVAPYQVRYLHRKQATVRV